MFNILLFLREEKVWIIFEKSVGYMIYERKPEKTPYETMGL